MIVQDTRTNYGVRVDGGPGRRRSKWWRLGVEITVRVKAVQVVVWVGRSQWDGPEWAKISSFFLSPDLDFMLFFNLITLSCRPKI